MAGKGPRGPQEILFSTFVVSCAIFILLQVLRFYNIIEFGPMWTK